MRSATRQKLMWENVFFVSLLLLSLGITRDSYSQTFFPCGTDDSNLVPDPSHILNSIKQYQELSESTGRDLADAVIPVAVLLVDPEFDWDYEALAEAVSGSFTIAQDEWTGYSIAFNIGLVEVTTNSQFYSRYLDLRGDMFVYAVVNSTSTRIPIGSCGVYNGLSPNLITARFTSSCMTGGPSGIFVHEFAHNFGIHHTFFPGNQDYGPDIWKVRGPDGNIIDNTGGCPPLPVPCETEGDFCVQHQRKSTPQTKFFGEIME